MNHILVSGTWLLIGPAWGFLIRDVIALKIVTRHQVFLVQQSGAARADGAHTLAGFMQFQSELLAKSHFWDLGFWKRVVERSSKESFRLGL